MSSSKIEWTEKTWNPVTGCNKVSAGCKNCYAEKMHRRLQVLQPKKYRRPFLDGAFPYPEDLHLPLRWKKPARIFVNSMSDLFHPSVPFPFIDLVFATMAVAHWHTYQILTKRPERMLEWFNYQDRNWSQEGMQGHHRIRYQTYHHYGKNLQVTLDKWRWPLENVWIGTSCENQETADLRIPYLLQCPAAVRFLSCEPLLGPIELPDMPVGKGLRPSILDIDQVIVGGESGPGARPMHPDWPTKLLDQCAAAGVPFFFKQWGAWKFTGSAAQEWNEGTGKVTPNDFIFDGTTSSDGQKKIMHRVGKKKAGRQLCGQEWNQYPENIHNLNPVKS